MSDIQIPTSSGPANHTIVPHDQWLAAHAAFLVKEKEFTRQRAEVARLRRELPWERIEKQYIFDTPTGNQSLADLFGKRSQLIVYHFMFAPEWEKGCMHCSFWADHYDAVIPHLGGHDVSFAVISRAPLSKIEPFKKRMGWKFNWVSSGNTDFNYDFQASFRPEDVAKGSVYFNYRQEKMKYTDREGASIFYKDAGGVVYHTYSCYARGIDLFNTTYHFLDLTPKGRDEEGPGGNQAWVRFHDQYPA